jgi:hypothetical protein
MMCRGEGARALAATEDEAARRRGRDEPELRSMVRRLETSDARYSGDRERARRDPQRDPRAVCERASEREPMAAKTRLSSADRP